MSDWAAAVLLSCQPTGITEYMSSPQSPIEIVETAAMANSEAPFSRNAPRQMVASQLTISRPIGTSRPTAISIAKNMKPSGIGAVYMFCIQASTPITAIAAIDLVAARVAEERLAGEAWGGSRRSTPPRTASTIT